MHRSSPTPALLVAFVAAALLAPAIASATTYRVTVTNVNKGQPLSPPVVAVHGVGTHIFTVGQPASPGLTLVAESGNPTTLVGELTANPEVEDLQVGSGPLLPGQSTTVMVESQGRFQYLSVVGMLGSTNDGFFGVDAFFLPERPWLRTVDAVPYDAGTEVNSEICGEVPGPPCSDGNARHTDGAEGMVLVHNGIHGIGDLDPAVWDFGTPVARITVQRLADGAR